MNILKKIFFSVCTTCKGNDSRTVRYAFPLVFSAFLFLGAQAITSDNVSYISVEPSTNSLLAGEAFYLDVYVNAHVPINAVDIELNFPEDQMKITGIDTGESVITLWTTDPYTKGNTVFLRGGTFRRGFVGEHIIATINAVATETGIAEIDVSDALLLAGDGAGTEVSVADTDDQTAKIYIADENGVFTTNNSDEEGGSELSATVSIKIVTDIDGDGDVSLADVSRFMSAWFTKSTLYDFNGDGRMTFRDFGIILSDSFFR